MLTATQLKLFHSWCLKQRRVNLKCNIENGAAYKILNGMHSESGSVVVFFYFVLFF